MTSEKKISANRKNAARSTGPKTAAGKLRSSRNALWHGLSTPLIGNDAYGKQIEAQASQLCDSLGVSHEIACVVAEAQVALMRVQRATVATINRQVHEQSRNDEASMPDESRVGMATLASLTELIAFRRYETRAISRFKRTLRQVEDFERRHAIRPPAPRVLPNVTTDRGAGESKPIHLKVTPRPTRKISLEYHANLTQRAFRCCLQIIRYTSRLAFKSEDEKLKTKKRAAIIRLSRIIQRNIIIGEPNAALVVIKMGLNAVDEPLFHALRACALLLAIRWTEGRSLLLLHRDKIINGASWASVVFDQLHEVRRSPRMTVQVIRAAEKALEAVYPYDDDVTALMRRRVTAEPRLK